MQRDETLSKKWHDAYNQGAASHPDITDCPYSPGSDMERYSAWWAGWHDKERGLYAPD